MFGKRLLNALRAPHFGAFGISVGLVCLAPRARADAGLPVHVQGSQGQPVAQQALSIFSAQGTISAASCATAPCSAGAVSLGVPAVLRAKPARVEVVTIDTGRKAAVLTVTDGTQTFQAVVAAPLSAGPPKIVFAGLVGLVNGQDGLRAGPMVQISEPDANGVRRLLVGEQNEGVSLCGRATILAPQLLSPRDLELHPAKVQRLSVAERDHAREVKALKIPDAEPSRAAASVLSALAASSAVGAPQALTDGNPETTWSENVGGDGKGEFVVMHAPPDLPITALELAVRPKTKAIPDGAAPASFFIAGPHEVVAVTLPEDAWQTPGSRYRIALDPPLKGSCLALVLDTASSSSKSAQVTVAELSVASELSPEQLPELVARLAGGGERAEAAKSLLVAAGPAGFAAIAQVFGGLDEGGKRVALDVMDQAPCDSSAPTYVAALVGKIEAQRLHAQSRLSRCGAAGGEALAKALADVDKTDKRIMPLLVEQLAVTDPGRAVTAFLPLMEEKTVLRRRLLRSALAQAARASSAAPAVRAALMDPATSEVALIDLLRSLGDQVPRFEPEAEQALSRLSQTAAGFRTRYLLLGPTASLSPKSPSADAAFRKSLGHDPDPHVRAAALSLVHEPARFQSELLSALADPDVRVREAGVHALSAAASPFATSALRERLTKDQWPLVRAAAADALSSYPPDAALDKDLVRGVGDDAPLVRARSIRALSERHVGSAEGAIRDRLEDDEEWPEVRAEAARALGALCDESSVDLLAAFAKKLADPMASPNAQLIAAGATASLGRLAPPNLRELLAVLLDKKAPPAARRAAGLALEVRPTCRAPAKK